MKLLFLTLSSFVFLLGCKPEPKVASTPSATKLQIDSIFESFNSLNTPGYAIGISKADTTWYQKGYGAANLEYDLPIRPDSRFSIASVSKQFTAACIALLILDEQLSLETPVSTFFPELNKYRDTIRIKHLIYNTSGILDYPNLERTSGKSWVTFNYFTIDECIATSLAQDTLLFKPGDQWNYCNVNFMLLAKIVERVSQQPFSDFAQKRLFEPLGMRHTLINDDITQVIKNRVTPYNRRTKENVEGYGQYGIVLKEAGEFIQHPRTSPHYGGSGVVSTIEDLLLWSKNMVTKEFGGQAFHDLMHATPTFNHDRNNQAFGLYFSKFEGLKTVAWEGGDWGISSQLIRFPDQEVSIVVLSNLGTGEAYRKAYEIAQVLIDAGLMD